MITREERKYLFWLGSTQWKGTGAIVEIGPWLGGSTACLAEGMIKSGHDSNKKLVVFDCFIWREFMADRAKLDLSTGDSFMPDFLENTKAFKSTIDAYQRSQIHGAPNQAKLSPAIETQNRPSKTAFVSRFQNAFETLKSQLRFWTSCNKVSTRPE